MAHSPDEFDDGTTFPFFVITEDPFWVDVADVVRVVLLIVGVMLMASAIWLLRCKHLTNAPGTRARVAFMVLAVFSIIGTEYNRLGEVVTSRIVVNVVALGIAALAVYQSLAPSKPPTRLEE